MKVDLLQDAADWHPMAVGEKCTAVSHRDSDFGNPVVGCMLPRPPPKRVFAALLQWPSRVSGLRFLLSADVEIRISMRRHRDTHGAADQDDHSDDDRRHGG